MRHRPKPRTRAAVARRTRRRRIVGAATSLVIVGGVAAAAVMGSVSITGKTNVGQFALNYATTSATGSTIDATTLADVPGGQTFNPTISSDMTTLSLPVSGADGLPLNAFVGEALAVTTDVKLASGAGRAGYVSGVTGDTSKMNGWTIRLVGGCGATLNKTGSSATVKVAIQPSAGASALDLGAAGIKVVASGGTAPTGLVCTTAGA